MESVFINTNIKGRELAPYLVIVYWPKEKRTAVIRIELALLLNLSREIWVKLHLSI